MTADVDSKFQPVPEIYYVNAPEDNPLTFGLGVYAPYGLSLDWGGNAPFGRLAQEGKMLYVCVNPVVAWRIHRTLSVAAGLTINYSDAEFKQGLLLPGDEYRLRGHDSAFGFNAGLRWQPIEQLAFGVNYRSATVMDYQGHSAG